MMLDAKWPRQWTSGSEQETETIAAGLAALFIPGDVIALHGELGAGKTCFVRGLVKGLGSTDLVNSPTFTIINQYQAALPVYHFDVYRINNPVEIEDLDIDFYLYDQGICIIEWGEKAEQLLPAGDSSVTISVMDQEKRHIIIEPKERKPS